MTEVSQGPGWWQASDGKWYPPQEPLPPAQESLPVQVPQPTQVEYCTNCAVPLAAGAPACANCGVPRLAATRFCWHCATPLNPGQEFCATCGAGLHGATGRAAQAGNVDSKRIVSAVLAFFLGAFGIHKFVLGDTSTGFIRLAITIFTCGLGGIVMSVIGIVEAIIYATMSDADFIQTYQVGEKHWF